MFAIVTSILLIPALITNSLLEKRKRKVFETLEQLPYLSYFAAFTLLLLKNLHLLKMGLYSQLD